MILALGGGSDEDGRAWSFDATLWFLRATAFLVSRRSMPLALSFSYQGGPQDGLAPD